MSSRRSAVAQPRRPELVALVALGVLALLATACKDTSKAEVAHDAPAAVAGDAAAAPAGPTRVVQVDLPGSVVLDQPKIDLPKLELFEVIDPGKGARAVLRYRLAPGVGSFVAQTTLASRHIEGDKFTEPTKLPAIRDGFAITVAADRPGQLALRALTGEALAASPDADSRLATWRQLLQNRRMTVAVDDRGQLGAIGFNDDPTGARSEAAKHELVQRLLSTIVPLPAEPVGTGASWRVVTILKQGPAYAKQTAIYTLVGRAARWTIHVKLTRVAEEQRLADPALSPGTTVDLLAMFRALEGDVEVDPAQPLITRASLTLESRLHVKITRAGTPPRPAPRVNDQIFEDTGTVVLSRQR